MREPCRFLFSDADAALIDRATLVVEDLPLTHDWQMGMRLRFKTAQNTRIMVRPLIACTMRFMVDQSAPGILPPPKDVVMDDANYRTWKVVGTLLLEFDPSANTTLDALAPLLIVKPTRIWLGPVTIPKEFLFNSLTRDKHLFRSPLKGGSIRVERGESLWQQHAISDFLAGKYLPLVQFDPDDPGKDDAIRMPMPYVGFNAGDNVHEIQVFVAKAANPDDAPDENWDPGQIPEAREAARLSPTHPRNGVVPARLVYQELASSMVPAATPEAQLIRDVVAPPEPRSFYPIRFTRPWEPIANTSIHFPQQMIVFKSGADVVLRRQRLPAHGILWVDENFYTNFSTGTKISLEGYMRWLERKDEPNKVDEVWKRKGEQNPVEMTTGPVQHIVLRLPMTMAMMADSNTPLGAWNGCTYLSMRRTVRALIDNRITGGRLNFGVMKTTQVTRDLFAGCAGVRASSVANYKPDPGGNPAEEAPKLFVLLNAMFDGDCVQHEIPGVPRPENAIVWKLGTAAYFLWQSGDPLLKDPRHIRNFSDRDIGRGGPGAAVMLGLAEYHCNIAPSNEPDSAYIDRMVGIMIDGLTAGATTQLWREIADFRILIDRTRTLPKDNDASGHSPIFVQYMRESGRNTGLVIIDQGGLNEETYDVVGSPPNRRFVDGLVWIAANWTE